MLRAKVLAGDLAEEEAEAILGKSVWDGQGKLRPYYPTPRASTRDNCGGSNARASAKRRGTYVGRKENPESRERQMGFPIGWTATPPLETPSALQSLVGWEDDSSSSTAEPPPNEES